MRIRPSLPETSSLGVWSNKTIDLFCTVLHSFGNVVMSNTDDNALSAMESLDDALPAKNYYFMYY